MQEGGNITPAEKGKSGMQMRSYGALQLEMRQGQQNARHIGTYNKDTNAVRLTRTEIIATWSQQKQI